MWIGARTEAGRPRRALRARVQVSFDEYIQDRARVFRAMFPDESRSQRVGDVRINHLISRARSCRFLQLARRNLSILGYCAGGMAGPHAAAAVPPPHRAPRRRHAAAAPRRRARPPSRAYSLTGHVFPSFPSCTGTCNYER
jgi:hypothetical protein